MTLGGLLGFRGLIWQFSGGTTVAPDDPTFVLIGGGPAGSLGRHAELGLRHRAGRGGDLSPLELATPETKIRIPGPPHVGRGDSSASWRSLVVLGAVYVANSYHWPAGLATQYAVAHGITEPPGGLQIEAGIPFPLVIIVGVTIFMTILATRRRYGRFIYAYGGNPDAAALAGINTRWTIMKTFILMGLLCAISAAIASARLNGGTLDLGTGYELYVIAAAVIGGTSFAGGIGTIPGAILGALVIQSLQYGLGFLGFNSPQVNMVAAIVLVAVVGIDAWNRRRAR